MKCNKLISVALIGLMMTVDFNASVMSSAEAKPHKARISGKAKKTSAKKAGPGDVWERIRAGIRIPVPSVAYGIVDIGTPRNVQSVPLIQSLRNKVANSAEVAAGDQGKRVTTVISPRKPPDVATTSPEKLRVRQVLKPASATPKSEDVDKQRYTAKGRLLFAKKTPDAQANEKLTADVQQITQAPADSGNVQFKSSYGRIRTRLGLTPELTNATATTGKNKSATTTQRGASPSVADGQSQIAVRSCADLRKTQIINLAREGILAASYQDMAAQCRNKQVEVNERIARQVGIYSRGFLQDVAERSRPFLFHVVETLSKHGLPLDLALLPIMESAYKPTALSSANAAGIWQFIPSTGRSFGLEQNAIYDERLEVTAATQAAARFLAGLRDHYRGDWLLALAAYNWGPGNVDAAIARNQAEGLDTDYWSLNMPDETRNYVPRLLALARIFSNPGGFGLKLRPLRNEPYFVKVNVDRSADVELLSTKNLDTVAKLADYDEREFGFLNTFYLNGKLVGRKNYTLLMPVDKANLLHKSLAFMAKTKTLHSTPLPFYAQSTFNPSQTQWPDVRPPLLALDRPVENRAITLISLAGDEVKSNLPSTRTEQSPQTDKADDYMFAHYLGQGETLKTVAEYHGLSEEALRIINNIKPKQILSYGQRLLIPFKHFTGKSRLKTSVLFQ